MNVFYSFLIIILTLEHLLGATTIRLRDNDEGLLYNRVTGEGFDRRIATPRALVRPAALRPPMPHSDWRPPTVPLNLTGAKRIAIDIETCDPDLKKLGPGVRRGGYIVGLAIGIDGGPREYFPIRHEGGDNCDFDVLGWWRDEAARFTGEVVGAKIDYDLDFLAEAGIIFPRVAAFHDILVAEPLLDEWRLSYALDALAKDYLGEGKQESLLAQACAAQGYDDSKTSLWRLPARFVGPYAEADVDLPLRIFPLQQAKLKAEGLMPVYEIERRLILVLLAMRRRGVRVDIGKAEEVKERLAIERDACLVKLKHLAGPTAELRAPDSFAPALRERGLQFPVTPKSQKPSITKGWLEANTGDELVDTIRAGRRVDTILQTFIEGHVLGHAINGRIHAQFHQLKGDGGGTIARLSSSLPNLQNLPARDEELGPLIRSIFIPEDGEEWRRQDASQIEFRYLTHFARGIGADEARRRYNEEPETDFHRMCGDFMHADATNSFIRKKVKGTNFCKIYGGGISKLAQVIGCSIAEAEAFNKAYDHALPFVETTYKSAMRWGERRGFVETILGRKQRFILWEPSGYRHETAMRYDEAVAAYGPNVRRAFVYAALNRKLQGSAADHCKKAMVDCWEAGLQNVLGAPLISVHDEYNLSVPRTTAGADAAQEAKRITEQCITLKVPMLVDDAGGESWGACS